MSGKMGKEPEPAKTARKIWVRHGERREPRGESRKIGGTCFPCHTEEIGNKALMTGPCSPRSRKIDRVPCKA